MTARRACRSCSRSGWSARSSPGANGSTAPSGRVTRRGRDQPHLLGGGGQHLGPDAAAAVGVVDDHQPAGALQRGGQRRPVERVQGARVEHLDRDLVGELRGDRQRVVDEVADRDQGDVGAGPVHARRAERDRRQLPGDRLADGQRGRRREQHDRVRVADGGAEQAVGVGRGGRHHGLHPGMREEAVRVVGVLAGPAVPGARPRDDAGQRHARLAARHQGELVRLVDELLEDEEEQRGDLELQDGAPPGQRRTDRHRGEGLFGERGVDDPLRPEALQQPERRAGQAGADVLAEHADRLVRGEFVGQRPVERLGVREPGHTTAPARGRLPSAYR